jgi:two-component system response regulator WspF
MRIAIVNDMMLAVEALRRIVAGQGAHQIAWIATDGEQAVELCAREKPDLILMDLVIPRLDGVEAIRRIMARTPCAILVVTADIEGKTSRVFEAMGAGALDAVNTPALHSSSDRDEAGALLRKIEIIRRLIGASVTTPKRSHLGSPDRPAIHGWDSLIAIGASAGGPAALAAILSDLPQDFSAPIVIVQHVDEQFARGLAEWLSRQTRLEVRVVREGDQPLPGTVLIAGMPRHLVFSSATRLSYSSQPVGSSYMPSIDVFFKSAEQYWQGDIIGILLTGMGRDGAEGLRSLRSAGHFTIAQDRASSAVYGMPKAAAELAAASEILSLEQIGPRLRSVVFYRTKINA